MSLTFLLLFLFLTDLSARDQQESGVGHRIGVSVSANETDLLNAENLTLLKDAGITVIEVEGMAATPLLSRLNESGISLFVRQDRKFSVPHQIKDSVNYLNEDRQLIHHYESRIPRQVVAYSLFRYPAEKNPEMRQQMSSHAMQINSDREAPLTLYYESAFTSVSEIPEGYAFRSARFTGSSSELFSNVIHFYPEGNDRKTVENLRNILTHSLEQSESVVLVELRPLLHLMEHYRPLTAALQEYAFNEEILFALPAPTPVPLAPDYLILILTLILMSYFFHYKYNPFYRDTLGRYFKTHHFFIEDVMEYRLRAPLAGIVQLLQFIVVGGLFVWMVAKVQLTPLGLEALTSHFPIIERTGSGMIGIFVLGILFTAAVQILSLAVIHIPAFKTRSAGQTINIYGWLLHLNLLVLILMVILLETGNTVVSFDILILLFLIIWLLNAVIACVDVARYLNRYRKLYLVFTIGTHLAIIALAVCSVAGSAKILQPLQLAFHLP